MKLFFSVSFFCYCLAARFVDHINIREFRGKNSSKDILSILRIWSSDSKGNARSVSENGKNRDNAHTAISFCPCARVFPYVYI